MIKQGFQKMGVSRSKDSIQKTTKNVTKTTGKMSKPRKLTLKLQHIHTYAAFIGFRGFIITFSGRKMEDHSWQETTDYDQF